jgi:hypothetical protein
MGSELRLVRLNRTAGSRGLGAVIIIKAEESGQFMHGLFDKLDFTSNKINVKSFLKSR